MIVIDLTTWAFADPKMRDTWARVVMVDSDPDHATSSIWRVWLVEGKQRVKETMRTTLPRLAIKHNRQDGDMKLIAHALYLLAKEGAADVA